jgi:hypothetical protein
MKFFLIHNSRFDFRFLFRQFGISCFIVAMCFCFLPCHAFECREGGKDRYLSKMIGIKNVRLPHLVNLPCDTMVVLPSDTVQILPNTLIQLGRGKNKEACIIVQGLLLVKGNSTAPVDFAGSFVRGPYSLEPDSTSWGGIRVTEGGGCYLRYARIFNTFKAIQSESEYFYAHHVFLKNCSQLVLLGLTYYPSRNQFVDEYFDSKLDTIWYGTNPNAMAEQWERDTRGMFEDEPENAQGNKIGIPLVITLGGVLGTLVAVAIYALFVL